ncbi:SPF1, partial [Symbiodinium sp. CCMP2456]
MKDELLLRHPPSLARVTVHAPAPQRKFALLAGFVALHGLALQFCIQTSGQAHQAALERVRKLNREHFLNGTKEEDKIPQEQLPSEWAPNPWASASLFATISLHVFFHLVCHWKVSFRASMLFQPARNVREGFYVQVTPLPHRGRAALVPLKFCETTLRLTFIFQRQHYECLEPGDNGTDPDDEVGEVQLTPCPVSEPLSKYLQATGVGNDDAEHLKSRFGDNLLEVELPSFFQCYKEQLLSPLVIFQVFVALIWAADDFFGYTLMQLLFILTMESTSVFQRLKTMKMLNSMGTKSYGIMVFRGGSWVEKSTSDLVPGDLIELVTVARQEGAADKVAPDIVPCDCVLIRGEAVASEASLTGESAPQMKDALVLEDRSLDLQGTDRVHCLFSGTRIVRASEGSNKDDLDAGGAPAASQVPATPNGGSLVFVARTGFASSQGQLLQMIEFSQDKVSGDTREVIIALLILLGFALVAAGYVLKVGLEKGDKTPHELLIKCVLILTAVVPKQLPIQTAMAVNTALMALSRTGVYCTEPYRVPLAGKLTHCFFDKTGTLTTDTLVPVGVVNASSQPEKDGHQHPPKVKVSDADAAAALVLAACHSLVHVDGKLSGDPIEVAALQGVGWAYDSQEETAKPAQIPDGDGTDASISSRAGIHRARILQRFHFASQLQRMAVVAEVSGADGTAVNLSAKGGGNYVLVKGSPEALKPLLAANAAPGWYDRSHLDLAERGLRVLALAFRQLPAGQEKLTREEAERELEFAGFIAFECLVRKDSGLVVGALQESDHKVIMVTGDSPLTALHIARTCGISHPHLPGLLLSLQAGSASPAWAVATGDRCGDSIPLTVDGITKLANEYALMATGEALDAAVAMEPALWAKIDEIRVFARMTPQGKAKIIEELQKQSRHVLMCGDGGNDVGALKQADAGLALLAGYGNVNTADTNDIDSPSDANTVCDKKAEEALNQQDAEIAKRNRRAAKDRQAFLWEKQKELSNHQKEWLEEEMQARAKNGDTGVLAQMGAMKSSMGRYTEELKKVMKEYDKTHGNVYDPTEKEKQKQNPTAALEEASGGLPMVRP